MKMQLLLLQGNLTFLQIKSIPGKENLTILNENNAILHNIRNTTRS